jgi:hypothetical protein
MVPYGTHATPTAVWQSSLAPAATEHSGESIFLLYHITPLMGYYEPAESSQDRGFCYAVTYRKEEQSTRLLVANVVGQYNEPHN